MSGYYDTVHHYALYAGGSQLQNYYQVLRNNNLLICYKYHFISFHSSF